MNNLLLSHPFHFITNNTWSQHLTSSQSNSILIHVILTVSYPMRNRGSFPGDKTAVAWSWPLIPVYCRG